MIILRQLLILSLYLFVKQLSFISNIVLKIMVLPWLVWLSGLSLGQQTERSPVRFPTRGTCLCCGPGPQLGARQSHTRFSPSHSLSFPLSLTRINKIFLKMMVSLHFLKLAKHYQRDMFLSSSFTINMFQKPAYFISNSHTFELEIRSPDFQRSPFHHFLSTMTLGQLLDILNCFLI